jgi:RND superfamily putative drug exporter
MGSVGAMSIAIGVLVAVSFTPAILSRIGIRVLSRKERKQLNERQAHHEPAAITSDAPVFATKRPVISVVATVVALGILAIPFGSMRLGLPDGKFESTESTGYKSYVLTEEAFGEGANATLIAVATAPKEIVKDSQLNYQADITNKLMKVENVVAVVPIGFSTDNSIAAFRVIPAEGPN